VFSYLVRTGDRIVLCSDGLVDEVSDADIAIVLSQHTDPQETAEALVMVANANGGRDNTTVVVVNILDDISEPLDVPVVDNTSPLEVVGGAVVDSSGVDSSGAVVGGAGRRRVSVGMVVFWSALVAIILSAVTVIGVYARSGYYLGFEEDRVAVYRGRVGGVLWFQPTIDTETLLRGDELPEDILRDVALNRTFTSSSQARKYLMLVQTAIIDATTSTTSSVPGGSTGATTTTVR